MDENIFKNDSKQIVDLFFNEKLFQPSVTRDDMNSVEELIAFLLQSRFEGYKRCEKLMEKIDKL